MHKLNFKPFQKDQLITSLKEKFPAYKVQNTFGNLQVRTSGFTATGNVKINANAKNGTITTQTNYDIRIIFMLISLPLGIYIYTKKEKQKKMEEEVVQKLNEIMPPLQVA